MMRRTVKIDSRLSQTTGLVQARQFGLPKCSVLCFLFLIALAARAPIDSYGQISSNNSDQITTLNSHAVRAGLLYSHTELGSFDSRFGSPLFTASDVVDIGVESDDPWLAMDKIQHLAFSFFITTGSQYSLVNKLDVRERRALPVSASISMLAGISKEVYDRRSRPNGYFSKRDLVADGIGIVLAAGLILL